MASAKEAAAVEAQETEITNEVIDAAALLGVRRYFTIPGRAPFDEVEWEIRDATIPGKNGPAFEQKDVEFPKFWSQTATISSRRSTSAAASARRTASAP